MFHASKIKVSKSAMPSTIFYTCCLKVGGVTWHGKNLHYKELNALYGTEMHFEINQVIHRQSSCINMHCFIKQNSTSDLYKFMLSKNCRFFLNHRSWYFSHFHKGELIHFSIFFILHQPSNWHIISFDSVVQMRYFHKFKNKKLR